MHGARAEFPPQPAARAFLAQPSEGMAMPIQRVYTMPVRLTHWVNAAAMTIMLTSGWRIHNAAPLFPFSFPDSLILGGWLGGAPAWHFAGMWLLTLIDPAFIVLEDR
jgi:thiosulfate reductase cytochrome b subunit